jgi:hypothetical protein
MSLTELAWLALAAYALHILEEFMLDWRGWARAVIGLPVEWHDFYVTNAVVVVLGLVQAGLAPSLPLAPLVFAALMLINATFFHVLPVLRTGGRFSPGVATAVVFFYPVGLAVFAAAYTAGQAGIGLMAAAFAIGAALMAFPIVLLKLRAHPYFRQA